MAIPGLSPGFGAGFNANQVRQALTDAMIMGMSPDPEQQVIWRWSPKREFADSDVAGDPYDWTEAPEDEEVKEDVVVPCAFEFSARPAGSVESSMGQMDTSRVVITLLDEHYEKVKGADLVLLGTNIYEVDFVAPPIGLFDMGVITVIATARDES